MRINFTESTLTTLKRTANCSYANAVYKLTMKAQQGLKCDDIYKKSVLMHEVNKLLCKYNLSETVYFNSTYSTLFVNVTGIGVLFSVFIGGEQVATDLSRQELYYYLISLGWQDNANLGPNNNNQILQIPAYLLAQYSNLQDIVIAYESNDIIYITRNDESSSVTSILSLGSYTAVDYTEEQLNCITPDNLQVLYEFTHKYKETAAKSSKKITAPSSTNSTTQDSNCCTWGHITGNIGNQSDLVNYLATVEKNMIAVEDEGTEITNDVKSINFVGSGVTATSSNGDVTVTIPGGGSGNTYTVDNGLHEDPINNFKLGGTLIEDTTIDQDSYLMTFLGSVAPKNDSLVNINKSGGLGSALNITSDKIGIKLTANSGGLIIDGNASFPITAIGELPSIFSLKNANASTITTLVSFQKANLGLVPSAIGSGSAISIGNGLDSSNNEFGSSFLSTRIVDNDALAKKSKVVITPASNTNADMFEVNSTGSIKLNAYNTGTFLVNDANYLLGVDTSGNVVQSENIVKTFKQEITMADFKTGTSVLILPAPGAGKAICVIEASFKLNGTTAYSGATGLLCIYATASGSISKKMFDSKDNTFFQSTGGGFIYKMADTNTHNASLAPNIFENESLSAKVFWTVGPTTGDLSATVYGSYRIINI